MKLKTTILMMVIIMLFSFSACGNDDITNTTTTNATDTTAYEQISPEEAKRFMDTAGEYIIVDARTTEEFNEGHIENAILIPEYEIANRAESEIPNKDTLILVYCRSGRRSKIASEELIKLGYTNVKEFGGIIDWPYDIVK